MRASSRYRRSQQDMRRPGGTVHSWCEMRRDRGACQPRRGSYDCALTRRRNRAPGTERRTTKASATDLGAVRRVSGGRATRLPLARVVLSLAPACCWAWKRVQCMPAKDCDGAKATRSLSIDKETIDATAIRRLERAARRARRRQPKQARSRRLRTAPSRRSIHRPFLIPAINREARPPHCFICHSA